MKKISSFFFTALFALLFIACNKQLPNKEAALVPETPDDQAIESLIVNLRSGARGTRAEATLDGTESGNTVSSATVYVFGADGNCLAHDAAVLNGEEWQAAFTLKKATGLTVAAVLNKSVSGITTLSSLRAKTTSLTDNSSDGFVMYGETSGVTTSNTDEVSIDVKHIAVMVEIDKITNKLKEEVFSSKPLVLKGIYLINVPVGAPAFSAIESYSPSTWANPCEFVSDDETDAFTADVDLDETIALNGSHSTPHYFYGYPSNVTSDNTGDTWDDEGAFTRLVVEVEWNGDTTWYYPVTFFTAAGNVFKANNRLVISELVIENPGSDYPNDPIEKEEATFELNVLDWVTVLLGDNGVVTL